MSTPEAQIASAPVSTAPVDTVPGVAFPVAVGPLLPSDAPSGQPGIFSNFATNVVVSVDAKNDSGHSPLVPAAVQAAPSPAPLSSR